MASAAGDTASGSPGSNQAMIDWTYAVPSTNAARNRSARKSRASRRRGAARRRGGGGGAPRFGLPGVAGRLRRDGGGEGERSAARPAGLLLPVPVGDSRWLLNTGAI